MKEFFGTFGYFYFIPQFRNVSLVFHQLILSFWANVFSDIVFFQFLSYVYFLYMYCVLSYLCIFIFNIFWFMLSSYGAMSDLELIDEQKIQSCQAFDFIFWPPFKRWVCLWTEIKLNENQNEFVLCRTLMNNYWNWLMPQKLWLASNHLWTNSDRQN